MRVQAVIRSTSEDVRGINVETLANVAARNVGIPVFVVEDFPGNYWPGDEQRLDGLFVEDASLVAFHCSRGIDPRIIYCTGNPRYDELRSVDRERRRLETRVALGLGDGRVMLWAGQPDGDNSYLTLMRLLERFHDEKVTLMFRAHPRDQSYATGKYERLLTNTSMTTFDTTMHADPISLVCASDLVVTQFSSVAVEASYLGIPALFVLFDDLGKQYLRTYKGYDLVPWCEAGCSFLIQEEYEVNDVMEEALFSRSSRNEVCGNFKKRFADKVDSAAAIARIIVKSMGKIKSGQSAKQESEPAGL
jgi:hypothetical protein